jgi:hypothetical protein
VSLAAPWQWTLPLLITCLLGAATAVGVIWTIVQRHRAEQRQQLWNRMQWALDAITASNPEARAVGAMAVSHLASMADNQTAAQRRFWKYASKALPARYSLPARPPAKLTQYDVELLDQALETLN